MAVVTSATPSSGTQDFQSGFTMHDRSVPLPPGQIISLGAFSIQPKACSLKIGRENATTNYDEIASLPFAHPGGGWADSALSYNIPNDGHIYRSGVFFAGLVERNLNTLRSYGPYGADLQVSSGNAMTADAGQMCFATRATYAAAPVCPPKVYRVERVAVILALGQSQAARYQGPTLYVPKPSVIGISPADGLASSDVLRGWEGSQSSYLLRLADKLNVDRVFETSIAVGGSTIESWPPGGVNNPKIAAIGLKLAALGLSPTAIIQNSGEQDHGTSTAAYLAAQRAVVQSFRNAGMNAPFYVTLESKWDASVSSVQAIRDAQTASVDPSLGIYQGADMDLLGNDKRLDGVHLNDAGAEAFADAMIAKLQ